jgi:hypothetical protein
MQTIHHLWPLLALMLALWTMMFVLDRIWPSNEEREQERRDKQRRGMRAA